MTDEDKRIKIVITLDYDKREDFLYQDGLRKMVYFQVLGNMADAEREIVRERLENDGSRAGKRI